MALLPAGLSGRMASGSSAVQPRPFIPAHSQLLFRQHCITYTAHRPSQHRFPLHEGLPLSLFHPFKRLPPDGVTLPAEEELCDPEASRCKTPMHVYEAKCSCCNGTGWARRLDRGRQRNGRRRAAAKCSTCTGMGYVRRTTSRFSPGEEHYAMTVNRPAADAPKGSKIEELVRGAAAAAGRAAADAQAAAEAEETRRRLDAQEDEWGTGKPQVPKKNVQQRFSVP